MKKIRLNKYFYLFILFVLFISTLVVYANETFQNNLLKVDFYKSSSGGIKVTLFTSKPYADPVNVNKRSDFEYVILLPETSNLISAKPLLNSMSDIVKDVNIKTQQYEDKIIGYTKITISTTKPIEVIPQVQTLNISKSQSDKKNYNKLLVQAPKKLKTPIKKEVKEPLSIKKETYKSVQKPKKQLTLTKKSKSLYKPNSPLPQTAVKKNISNKLKESLPIEPSVQQKVVVPVVKKETVTPIKESVKRPVKEAKKEITPATTTAPAPTPTPTPAPKSVQMTTPTPTPTSVQTSILAHVKQISQPAQCLEIMKKYKGFIYSVLGIILAIFILLLLSARKMAKDLKKKKETFTNHLKEKPESPVDYTEKFSEDMTWQEKFQTYADTEQEQNPETAIPEETVENIEELEELFGEEPYAAPEQEIPQEDEVIEKEEPQVEMQQAEEESILDELSEMQQYDFEEAPSAEKLFSEEEIPSFEQPVVEEISEPEEDELIKSEFAIDDEKGFYLVDFENTTALVGHIKDEIFILKRFKEKTEGPLQARLSERKANNIEYMTKIGNFKALIEITPNDMNLLIEL